MTPSYAIQYYGWGENFNTTDAQAAWNDGTEVFDELQTCGSPCDAATSTPIANVTNGSYDAYLTTFANSVKAFGHPVLLTYDHEMNGDWYPWGDTEVTPAQWIASWQHVTTLISSIAPNVTWVWAPNIAVSGSSIASYWPGNGYSNPHVGVVGLDGYYQTTGSTWTSIFTPSVTQVKSASGNNYPFIVAETGVPSTDSNDVSQIDNLLAGARSVNAQAVMYFDKSNWALTAAGQSELIKDVQ
jgi:beta-mannanase